MPKKRKVGSNIVVPKTVLENAKTAHSTRARKLQELIELQEKIEVEKDPSVQKELRVKRRKLNDSLNLKPEQKSSNSKPNSRRGQSLPKSSSVPSASTVQTSAASSSNVAPSLGPRRRASAPAATTLPLSSPVSTSAQRLQHVSDGVLSVANSQKENVVRQIGCANQGLHFMICAVTNEGVQLWRRKGVCRWDSVAAPSKLPHSVTTKFLSVGDISTFCLGVENIKCAKTKETRDEIVMYVARPNVKVKWAVSPPGRVVSLTCLGEKCAALVRTKDGVMVWLKSGLRGIRAKPVRIPSLPADWLTDGEIQIYSVNGKTYIATWFTFRDPAGARLFPHGVLMLFHVEPRDTTEVLNCIASTPVPADFRIVALPGKPCINQFQKVITFGDTNFRMTKWCVMCFDIMILIFYILISLISDFILI